MKINSTSVTGVFMYTDDAKFEENDFVIYGTAIYVCKPKDGVSEVSGEIPPSSENYIIYLGDQSTDISEYLEFLTTGEGENKYLSTLTLQQVLNSFILGPDGKGVIGDSIMYSKDIDENTGKPIYECHLSNGSLFTDPESVLSDIMNDRNINHAIFRVSRLLPEIVVYVGKPINTENTTTDLLGCILRQYTYKSEDTGHTIRIQELIDQVDGLIYYRSADIDVETNQLVVTIKKQNNGNAEFRYDYKTTWTNEEIFDFINFLYPEKFGEFKNIHSNKENTFNILLKIFRIISQSMEIVFVVDNLGEEKKCYIVSFAKKSRALCKQPCLNN